MTNLRGSNLKELFHIHLGQQKQKQNSNSETHCHYSGTVTLLPPTKGHSAIPGDIFGSWLLGEGGAKGRCSQYLVKRSRGPCQPSHDAQDNPPWQRIPQRNDKSPFLEVQSVDYVPWPVSHQEQFYWNPAVPSHLPTVCSCFCAITVTLSNYGRDWRSTKPRLTLSDLLQKVC